MVNIFLIIGLVVVGQLAFFSFVELLEYPESRTFWNIFTFVGLVMGVVSLLIILFVGGTHIYLIK